MLFGSLFLGACSSSGDTGTTSSGITGDASPGAEACGPDFTSGKALRFSAGMNETSADGMFKVAIDSDPPVPTLGDHSTWKLMVTDGAGNPVAAGTKVKVTCVMTHTGFSHGCPAPISVKEMGNGVYSATPVIFNMQGNWVVDIDVGPSGDVPFPLCIE
jgi:hypothetical protein